MENSTAVFDTSAPNLIIPIDGMNVKDQIERRRAMVNNPADYAVWGKMYRLLFDPLGMNLPDVGTLDHPISGLPIMPRIHAGI